jgi:hypothetical protein
MEMYINSNSLKINVKGELIQGEFNYEIYRLQKFERM